MYRYRFVIGRRHGTRHARRHGQRFVNGLLLARQRSSTCTIIGRSLVGETDQVGSLARLVPLDTTFNGWTHGSSKLTDLAKVLIFGGCFLSFRSILIHFGQFWRFSGVVFPILMIFPTSRHVSQGRRRWPCTIAHHERELKRANWAPKVSFLSSLLI